jgi:hypothetical protein
MSSPIMPIGSRADLPSSTAPAIRQDGDAAAFISELAAEAHPLGIQAARMAPPREVLEQVAQAGAVHERMRGEGLELRFTGAEQNGPPRVAMIDAGVAAPRELSLTEAFAIAAGGTPE